MKVLVAGGAGFLGSHLCRKLLEKDNEVICLDNLFTGNKKNIDEFLNDPDFKFVEHDITKPFDYDVKQIYNLACPASPPFYQDDPIRTTKISFLGTLNCLELAERTGARFLQASTSEVYGNPNVHPQPESYLGNVNPIGPRACYDEGKRVAESLCFDYHRKYNVDIRVVRIFNTYGPNMDVDDGRVVSNFIVQALRGVPLTIYGDGKQTRSFCYVDDLIEGMLQMMEHMYEKGPINLGNPGEFTIKELAHKVIDMTDSKSEIEYQPLPVDDPIQRCPDITLAKNAFGWEPKISLEEGLKKTIPYFSSKIKPYTAS